MDKAHWPACSVTPNKADVEATASKQSTRSKGGEMIKQTLYIELRNHNVFQVRKERSSKWPLSRGWMPMGWAVTSRAKTCHCSLSHTF